MKFFLVICMLLTAGCSPGAKLVYPESEATVPAAIEPVLDDLSSGQRIRLQVVGGGPIEAKFQERADDAILIKRMFWKKNIIGKELKERDEVVEVSIPDIHELHVYRYSTLQKAGSVVGALWALSYIVVMSTTDSGE